MSKEDMRTLVKEFDEWYTDWYKKAVESFPDGGSGSGPGIVGFGVPRKDWRTFVYWLSLEDKNEQG